jgi:hypothetical protein
MLLCIPTCSKVQVPQLILRRKPVLDVCQNSSRRYPVILRSARSQSSMARICRRRNDAASRTGPLGELLWKSDMLRSQQVTRSGRRGGLPVPALAALWRKWSQRSLRRRRERRISGGGGDVHDGEMPAPRFTTIFLISRPSVETYLEILNASGLWVVAE